MAKVFILESPSPADLLNNRNERSSLEQVCRLFGHDTASFLLRDRDDFKSALGYVGAMGWASDEESPVFIHISSHGAKDGLVFGPDEVHWKHLGEFIVESYRHLCEYSGPVVLILSACHANKQKLTRHLNRMKKQGDLEFPPEYILVFGEERVDWRDAVVTWTVFYRKANDLDWTYGRDGRTTVQSLLALLHKSRLGDLTYFRWDSREDRYLRWPKQK